ncbi:MAG: HlyD family efflux transporter periplasmic adaptor subunit [Paramuribaculum sp.]|nr:HlyD family efflux transporter periplasmic adaptor subunit [Paramuribaculum sp.]
MDRPISQDEISRRRRRIFIRISCGVAVAILAVILFSRIGGRSIKASDLRLGTADSGTIEVAMTASGRVVPAFEQTITSPIESRIVEVYATAGDTLSAGTPLLLLDLADTETELKSLGDRHRMKQLEIEQTRINNATRISNLEMQLKVKQMTVERLNADLLSERRRDGLGSGTGEKVRQAELAYRTGVLELEQLRRQLDGELSVNDAALNVSALDLNVFESEMNAKRRTLEDARLLSPRAATLTFIADEIGKRVGPGEKLAVISDLRNFRIEGQIADTYADRLSIGQRAVVRLGSERIEGTVTNIQPSSLGGVVTFNVRLADENNSKLRPGIRADIYVMTDLRDNVVRIPRGTFYTGPGDADLWVVSPDGSELLLRKTRLGDANYDFVEVLEGINPGEQVLTTAIQIPTGVTRLKIKQ